MRSYVRYAAVACAASMLVLAGCGSEPAAPASPNLAEGSLTYAITPAQLSWTRIPGGPMPTDSLITLISGLIAVGGYPQFGAIQYSGGPSSGAPLTGAGAYGDWLDMSTRPNLSRSPLGWRFVFKLKPNATNFPIGRYQATIPVTVGGASNNPQNIVVVFNHCNNCLFVGDERVAEMTGSAPTWNRGNALNESGGYRYEDWRVFVPPFTSVQVDMFGQNGSAPCGPYTLYDPYLYAFGPTPATTFVDSDDDAGCGYDAIIYLFNGTATQQEYLVRATNFSTGNGGTYKMRVSLYGGGYTLRAWEPGDKATAELRGGK